MPARRAKKLKSIDQENSKSITEEIRDELNEGHINALVKMLGLRSTLDLHTLIL
nr:hypothetical protein [Gracilibacillus suaedae]